MKILNVPNVLTILRMIMIPVFIYVFFAPIEHSMLWAAFIYALAAFTDFLDGRIARKYNLITDFGKLFDPLADKLLQISAVLCLVIAKVLPLWFLIFYLVKEGLQVIGGSILYKKGYVVSSNIFGKVASVLFYIATAAFLVFNIDVLWKNVILIVVVAMAVIAFAGYAKQFYTQKKELDRKKASGKEDIV